jgi:hypothetical protein
MDNRLIFLYFNMIVQERSPISLLASIPFGEYVDGEGSFQSRSGVTGREDRSVCIDCTCKT